MLWLPGPVKVFETSKFEPAGVVMVMGRFGAGAATASVPETGTSLL
jgi:hypothetical protein